MVFPGPVGFQQSQIKQSIKIIPLFLIIMRAQELVLVLPRYPPIQFANHKDTFQLFVV